MEYRNQQFHDWATNNKIVNNILDLKNLNEFIDLANKVIVNNAIIGRDNQFKISTIGGNDEDNTINLAQFELAPQFVINTMQNIDDPTVFTIENNNYKALPKEIAQSIIGISNLEKSITHITDDKNIL